MDACRAIVIVGRDNLSRRSHDIDRIAERLRQHGYAVHWFESERRRATLRINAGIGAVWPQLVSVPPARLPALLRIIRFGIKAILVLASPNRRDFVRAALQPKHVTASEELRRFLRTLPAQHFHLITHSAGGIAATKIAADEKVERIICFGYPFKHPERPPEAYRTQHLASLTKPVLILQGYDDIYGADPVALGHYLSPSSRLDGLNCDHNYEFPQASAFEQTWNLVAAFVGLNERSAAPHRAAAG